MALPRSTWERPTEQRSTRALISRARELLGAIRVIRLGWVSRDGIVADEAVLGEALGIVIKRVTLRLVRDLRVFLRDFTAPFAVRVNLARDDRASRSGDIEEHLAVGGNLCATSGLLGDHEPVQPNLIPLDPLE